MINGPLLPTPAGGASAPQRPLPASASDDGFAGAMEDALDAPRLLRRDDHGASAAPRRPEPARSREIAGGESRLHARKAPSAGRTSPARNADRAQESDARAHPARDTDASGDDAAMPDVAAQPKPEAKARPESGADATADDGGPCDAGAGTTQDSAPAHSELAAVATGPEVVTLAADGSEDGSAVTGGDSPARGRRWQLPASDEAGDQGKGDRIAVPRTGGHVTMPMGQRHGQPAAATPVVTAAIPGEAAGERALPAVAATQTETGGDAATTGAPVTQAVQAAAVTPQTASAADAATAIENAVTAVETVAAAEGAANADSGSRDPREQGQSKPQAASSENSLSQEAMAVGGASDGMRLTVNGATGNAAYTNAAPRHEEAVLPQIVQSIRLHAVAGTTEARVQLRPEHLGGLNITLKVEQNQVTATIQADVAAVRAWIESHESSLRQGLADQGLHLSKLVVQEDGQQAPQDEQGGGRPRRQPQRRRSWRDEEATFEVLV